MARLGNEPKTSDLQIRCPTDCAAQPGPISGIHYHTNMGNLIFYKWGKLHVNGFSEENSVSLLLNLLLYTILAFQKCNSVKNL